MRLTPQCSATLQKIQESLWLKFFVRRSRNHVSFPFVTRHVCLHSAVFKTARAAFCNCFLASQLQGNNLSVLSCCISPRCGIHYSLAAPFGFGAPNADISSGFRSLSPSNPSPPLASLPFSQRCVLRSHACFPLPFLPSFLLSIPSPPMTNIFGSSNDKASHRVGCGWHRGHGRDWPSSIFALLFLIQQLVV